jgi:hypothetical protein
MRFALVAFGTRPFPYHLVSWLIHGVNVVLAYLLAKRAGADRTSGRTCGWPVRPPRGWR